MLGLAGSLFLTAGGIVAVTDGESPTVVALVGGASLAIDILWLVLIFKTWRGRRWAWITVLVWRACRRCSYSASPLPVWPDGTVARCLARFSTAFPRCWCSCC
jgi:hypothetical protein